MSNEEDLDKIIETANNMSNMMIAHKIATDKDFRLEAGSLMSVSPIIGSSPPISGPMDSQDPSLHHQVKDIVHEAFWNVFREEITAAPPVYKIYNKMMSDIKQRIMDLLLPQHTRLKQEIDDQLDLILIEQQARNDALDIIAYGHLVVRILSKLCAPVRDDKIKELMGISDPVELHRGIMELLEGMRLDFANFTLNRFRPHIKAHSQAYERDKFNEILAQQSSMGLDGLEYTRIWLKRAVESVEATFGLQDYDGQIDDEFDGITRSEATTENGDEDVNDDDNTDNVDSNERDSTNHGKNVMKPKRSLVVDVGKPSEALVNKILNTAYCELLEWTNAKQEMFPETLLFDESTFYQLKNQYSILVIASSILLTTFALTGQYRINLDDTTKGIIKSHIITLLTAAYEQPTAGASPSSSTSGGSSRNTSPNRSDGSPPQRHQHLMVDIDHEKMETIAVRVVEDIRAKRKEQGQELPREFDSVLRRQILDLQSDRNRIKSLANRRIIDFVETFLILDIKNQRKKLKPQNAPPVNIPLGLGCLVDELTMTLAQFVKIVRYNRNVFLEHYQRLIAELVAAKLRTKT